MTRNERKRAAKAKRNHIISEAEKAIAIEAERVAARNAREEFLRTYTVTTVWSPRGTDKVARDRIGSVQTQGGVRKFVSKQAKDIVVRPRLTGEALKTALAAGTIGEKMRPMIGKAKKK